MTEGDLFPSDSSSGAHFGHISDEIYNILINIQIKKLFLEENLLLN